MTFLLPGFIALSICMVALWLLSLKLTDVSIIDIFWGPAFGVFLWTSLLAAGATDAWRNLLLAGLVALWGARLGGYLFWRNHGKGEDRRYVAMRRRNPRFAYQSLVTVFGLQGALVVVVSLPLQSAMVASSTAPFGALDALGLLLFAVGLYFETVGDLQLARFKADPANKGQVMDRGLWRYTRHPNYFGDFCVHWGFFLLSLAGGAAPWTAVGPAAMSVLLMKVSGVTLLEKDIGKRRPKYADYIRTTSAFFPQPPRALPGS